MTRRRVGSAVDSRGDQRALAGVAALLLIGGGVGLGLGLGGMALPRCEPLASRFALVGGGVAAVLLGAIIGAGHLLG